MSRQGIVYLKIKIEMKSKPVDISLASLQKRHTTSHVTFDLHPDIGFCLPIKYFNYSYN